MISNHAGTTVRVLLDERARSGEWNMAVDAFLLESALQEGHCTLRWYRWCEPTLSLGHFQRCDDPLIDVRFSRLPRVLRLSGGGAILHDRELTYSCAIPPGHPLAARPSDLYRAMHAAIAEAISGMGVKIAPRDHHEKGLDSSFLCFSRGDANDLVLNGRKVMGSAQRRRRGAVLQHGSLLLRQSPFAPEHPGLFDLAQALPEEELLDRLVTATATVLSDTCQFVNLMDAEREQIRQIVDRGVSGRRLRASTHLQ
jgi:lipoyl(octanoyl) transferase